MVDPTRKRSKGHGSSGAGNESGSKGGPLSGNPLIFWTAPAQGRSCLVDLSEFTTGRSMPGASAHIWAGDFTGRSQIIEELAPTIHALFAVASEYTVTNLMTTLRNFWRLLDSIASFSPCACLTDINEAIAALWIRSGVCGSHYKIMRRIVFEARKARGLPPQAWPRTPEDNPNLTDSPSHAASKALYHILKGVAQKILMHWANGDRLAAEGNDPRIGAQDSDGRYAHGTFSKATDRAALLKALMIEYDTPLPNTPITRTIGAYDSDAPLVPGAPKSSCTGIGGQMRWFYPSFEDTCIFLLLFLLLTGWNGQVAFDLDVSSNSWWESHPMRQDLVMIHSVKQRAGGTIQTAISMVKPTFHPYQVLVALLERTAPLRNELRRRLSAAEAAFAKEPADTELKNEVERLREGVCSPWLFFTRKPLGDIQWLRSDLSDKINDVLDAVVEQANELIKLRHAQNKTQGDPKLIGKLVTSDFRDAWIGYAYANSGYNWLIAKLAAGHNSINALRDYLRKLRWRAHGEKQYRKFMDALWAEIGERRVVDPAILKWLVEHGEITDEQRQRWEAHKDRTRLGMGCKDFYHPPTEIAPDHVDGCGCRVQRCTLCRHGVVFDDSLDGITMRMAELEHIQATISLTAWNDSSFPDEVEETKKTLTLFKPDAVQTALEKWRNAIASSRHYVFQFEGSYKEVTHG